MHDILGRRARSAARCAGILVLLLVHALHACAQREPFSIHYTTADGLPHNNVYCVMQDREHLIWFGTEHGVARFDGRSFTNLSTADGLNENDIISIHQDRRGRIWFMGVSGRPCFYDNGIIHNIQNTPWLRELRMANYSTVFEEDRWGNIYFGSSVGDLLRLDTNNCVTRLLTTLLPFPKYSRYILDVMAITPDSQEVLSNIHIMERSGPYQSSMHEVFQMDTTLTDLLPIKSVQHPDGRRFFSFGKHLAVFRGMTLVDLAFHALPKQAVFIGLEDVKTLRIGTSNGVYYCHVDSIGCPITSPLLVNQQVQYILSDHEGGKWYCTTNGIFFMPKMPFEGLSRMNIPLTTDMTSFLPYGNAGLLLGGKDGSLHTLDHMTGQFGQVLPPSERMDAEFFLIEESKPGYYLAYCQKGMYMFDGKVSQLLFPRKLNQVFFEGDTTYYCSPKGLFLHRNPGQVVDQEVIDSVLLSARSNLYSRCYSLSSDSSGRMWAVILNHVYRLKEGRPIPFKTINERLEIGNVKDMLTAPNGDIWVATNANGLYRIHGDSVDGYSTAEGLVSSEIHDICIDHRGWLWAASPAGASCLIPKETPSGMRWEATNLLLTHEVLEVAASGGRVFLLQPNEVIIIDGGRTADYYPSPKAAFLKIQTETRSWAEHEQVELSSSDPAMTIVYTGITFRSTGSINFRYRVVPEASDASVGGWTMTDASSLSLTSFAPGSYRFELQARARQAGWSPYTASFRFIVHPPFFLRTDVLVVSAVILLVLAALTFWVVIALVKRRADTRRRVMEAEHKALISQMNPHFIFNSLNSIQNYFLSRDIETANDYLADFSSLMRAILDSGRINRTMLSEEIRLIRLYLNIEQMRMDGKFDYTIELEEGIHPDRVNIPPLLLQPFLENAIWHGIAPKDGHGTISIRFLSAANGIRCAITDDGVGRAAVQVIKDQSGTKRKSHATSIVNERLSLLNSGRRNPFTFDTHDLHDPQGKPIGTQVVIFFPQPYP